MVLHGQRGGPFGTDYDILVARSTDNGATWTDPAPLNTTAATDSGFDVIPQVAEEIRVPFRAVGKLILISIGIAMAWYVLIQWTVGLTLDAAALEQVELMVKNTRARREARALA